MHGHTQVCRGYGDPDGEPHGYGYGVGKGIEIRSPRQRWSDGAVYTAQNVVAVERRLGGRLLVKPKQIVFQSATRAATSASSSLCLGIEDLTAEWRCKIAHNYQVDQHSTRPPALTSLLGNTAPIGPDAAAAVGARRHRTPPLPLPFPFPIPSSP